MSRDPRDAPEPGPGRGSESDELEAREAPVPGASRAIDPARGALLTAYVDGVAELAADERHQVEAWLTRDPDARAEADAVQALLGRLRALPPNAVGDEPDWAAMQRSIHQAIAAEPPRPWWRRWRWLAPAMTCVTAAAVVLAIWPRAAPRSMAQRRSSAEPTAPAAPPADSVVALWLDGSEVDVDVSTPDALGDIGQGLDAAAAQPLSIEEADETGLLPATDLAWVDSLDDAALERAERWLANSSSQPTAEEKKI